MIGIGIPASTVIPGLPRITQRIGPRTMPHRSHLGASPEEKALFLVGIEIVEHITVRLMWFTDCSLQTIFGPENRASNFNDLQPQLRQPFLTATYSS